MSYFADWSDLGGYGGNLGSGPGQAGGQSGGQPGDPYFQVKTDGPFAGWNNYALDNLKGSLSPMDYGAFLQDRLNTHFANYLNQDQNAPPEQFKLEYAPADYGAPRAGQADNSGQGGGVFPGGPTNTAGLFDGIAKWYEDYQKSPNPQTPSRGKAWFYYKCPGMGYFQVVYQNDPSPGPQSYSNRGCEVRYPGQSGGQN